MSAARSSRKLSEEAPQDEVEEWLATSTCVVTFPPTA
jgi:hypothetical protein